MDTKRLAAALIAAPLLLASLAACGEDSDGDSVRVTSSHGTDITNASDFLTQAEKEWRSVMPDFATVSDDAGCWFDSDEIDSESEKPMVGERVLCGPAVIPEVEPKAWSSGTLEEKVSGDGVTLSIESWDLFNATEAMGNLIDASAKEPTASLATPEAKPMTMPSDIVESLNLQAGGDDEDATLVSNNTEVPPFNPPADLCAEDCLEEVKTYGGLPYEKCPLRVRTFDTVRGSFTPELPEGVSLDGEGEPSLLVRYEAPEGSGLWRIDYDPDRMCPLNEFYAEVDGQQIEWVQRDAKSSLTGEEVLTHSITTSDAIVFAAPHGTTLTLWEHALVWNGAKETEYDGTRFDVILPEVE